MKPLKNYIASLRLRTLPLSAAGVCLGIMLAASDYLISPAPALLTLLTAVLLQILSNLSNELGDAASGTDSADRQGPKYAIASGLLSVKELKTMTRIAMVLCMISGLAMILTSFGTLLSLEPLMLLILGVFAINAAMRYTLGKNPYGYRGWGDLSVFIFFGIVSVAGSYFVSAHEIRSWILLLPAASIGAFSVGVLNVNNIRDMKTDAATRSTVPLKIGERSAKIYHTLLIAAGWACMIAYSLMRIYDPWHYLYFVTLPLFVIHLAGVWKRSGKALDKMLPLLSLSSLAFALTAGAGYMIYLF